jgi:hypothetical protein
MTKSKRMTLLMLAGALLVLTAERARAAAPPDHFKCYKVKDTLPKNE